MSTKKSIRKNIHIRTIYILLILVLFGASACSPRMCPYQPKNKGDSGCMVRMRHYHQGELYKGLPWYRAQHLRYGERYSDNISRKNKKPIKYYFRKIFKSKKKPSRAHK